MPESESLPISRTALDLDGGLFRRAGRWLFSAKHFHYKLLSGTIAAVVVIIFLAGLFFFVALRTHHEEQLRAHTQEVMRLGGTIENDLAQLENFHRAYLLTHNAEFIAPFNRETDVMKKRWVELSALVQDSPAQRDRVTKAQNVVQHWLDQVARPSLTVAKSSSLISAANLGSGSLDPAREILQSLQDEAQIAQRIGQKDSAAQSTQILDFLPKLERAVIEMEKEARGYFLTNEPAFLEAYRRSLADFYTYHGYLTILVANSPAQAQLLSDIRSNLERWINSAATPAIEARQRGRDVSAVEAGKSAQLIHDVQNAIADFQRNELANYETRASAATRQRIVRTLGLTALALLAVSLLISSNSYSFVLVRRHLSKLEAAEIRIRAIIESILDGMIIVDQQGTIRLMNPAAEKLFGCATQEMIGQKFMKMVPRAYASETESQPLEWEEFTRRTGTTVLAIGKTRQHITFPIEISLSQMLVDRTMLYVAMIRDVTERKRFERELAAEKESLAVTLRSITDGVITTDVQGRITMINHAGEMLTGWTTEEAEGQPLKSVFKISIDLAAQARAQRNITRNEAHSILLNMPENASLVSREGIERLIEQVASPIRDRRNEIAGVVLVFRDITERERSETERRKAESLEQLGLLAGGIAHDFNNLLTAIIGNISLASLLNTTDKELLTRLGDAKNASMRARDLAQQLLTFARGGAPIKKTASIGRLVKDTVGFSLRGSHSRSQFEIPNDLWAAEVDTGQISQVIANLVVNADQAMPNGGTLRVTCDNFQHTASNGQSIPELAPGDYVRISIRDEGTGIPEQYLERIFDPYFTTKAKGNGLGLATTYSIIKHHKGLITVESEVNVGSTFTIFLPAAPRIEVPQETPITTKTDLRGTGRVLIVDDEEAIRALVEFTLTHLGYEVAMAESALEGVDLYKQELEAGQRFDVVILDLTLPGGMGGKEAFKRLQEIDPTVNAIVSSGYANDATMSQYRQYGFRGVIAKPYEAAELGRIVREVIESSHLHVAA